MKKFLFYLSLIAIFFSLMVSSCDSSSVGVGEEVDTEAPVLKITSPKYFSYVSKTFTVTGTCVDNKKVVRVEVSCAYKVPKKDSNGNAVLNDQGSQVFEYVHLPVKNAVLKEDSWACEISVEDDAEISITATAYDAMGIKGVDYSQSVDVVVDTANPMISDVLIKRNDEYSVNLMSLDGLKGKDESNSSDKDYLQNEEFKITANIREDRKLTCSYILIYDENGKLLLGGDEEDERIYPDGDNAGTFTPEWTIKGSDLIAKDPKYASGRHYIFPKIIALDGASNIASRQAIAEQKFIRYEYEPQPLFNTRAIGDSGKFICWYPESDIPKASFPLYSGDSITVQRDMKIPVSVFDDDGLGVVYYGLVDIDTKARLGSTIDEFKDYLATNPSVHSKVDLSQDGAKEPDGVPKVIYELDMKNCKQKMRDLNLSNLSSGSEAATYSLVILIEDLKVINGYESKYKYFDVKTSVDSKEAPIIIVETPTENTSAELGLNGTPNTFTISGYTLDDKNVSKMAIAWIPGDNDQLDEAYNELNKFDFASDFVTSSGIKIFNMTTTPQANKDVDFNKYKNEFSHTFNILEDFVKDGDIVNDNKLFVIYVVDTEGNVKNKTFRLGSYTADPTFEIWYSSDNISWEKFDDALITFNSGGSSDIYFKVLPQGANGLTIKDNSLKGKIKRSSETTAQDITFTQTDGYYYFSESVINGGRIDLNFECEDTLGNKAPQKKSVIFGDIPTLKNLSTGLRGGIILIKDDKLLIQANFSTNVIVQSVTSETAPYIELSNITIDGLVPSQVQKAVYKSGSGTDTLIFEYIAPDGAESLQVETPNTISPITDSSNRIIGNITNGSIYDSISNEKIIKIDAVPPKIDIPKCVPGKNAKITDDKVVIEFNEDIFMEAGTVTLQRTQGWAIPPVLDNNTFMTIYSSVDSDDKITLIGSDTGEAELLEGTGTPKGPYKKITHGVKVEGGKVVPDIDTKYVLAFEYDGDDLDIFDDTGKVQEIRDVLERYGYHKVEFDISECEVSGKTIEIPIPENWLVDGRQFEVVLSEGCVRDDAGNLNDALERGVYTFWSDKVATPVIRVDRYTHGAGVKEPAADGTLISITDDKIAFNTAPTGYARVKIDCETPGAAIKYDVQTLTSSVDITTLTDVGDGKTNNAPLDDIASTDDFFTSAAETAYSDIFVIGNDDYKHSNKYYIKASATFATVSVTQPVMQASEVGLEGAYRTVLYCANPSRTISEAEPLYWQGSCSKGEPLIAGFPMRDANPDFRYSRALYKYGDSDYVGISWEIVSTFRMQTWRGNWSKSEDMNCSYGWVIYNTGRGYW